MKLEFVVLVPGLDVQRIVFLPYYRTAGHSHLLDKKKKKKGEKKRTREGRKPAEELCSSTKGEQ
jgi:hypothetical protein